MIALAYGAALLGAIGCMALLDARFRLVLWSRPGAAARRVGLVLVAGIVLFLLWDLAAIALGFYHRGESEAMTGIMLGPELPLEELGFITFLCYLTLVLHGLVGMLTGARRALPAGAEVRR